MKQVCAFLTACALLGLSFPIRAAAAAPQSLEGYLRESCEERIAYHERLIEEYERALMELGPEEEDASARSDWLEGLVLYSEEVIELYRERLDALR